MIESDMTLVRQSELSGRMVLDIATTEELGKLAQLRVDANNQQVEGFICRSGLLGLENVPVMWVEVESVGQDSILVRSSGSVATARFDEAFPLEKLEVWADSGNRVGQLVDFCMALRTGTITQYLFTVSGWKGLTEGIYTFQPEAVVSLGRKRIMVRQAALETASQFVPGVPDRIAEAWQKDVERTRQDLRGAASSTQDMAGQVQQQTQKFTEQAKTQLGQVFGEVKRRSKHLRHEVNDRFADAAANLQSPQKRAPEQIPGTTIDVDSEEIWTEEDEPKAGQ